MGAKMTRKSDRRQGQPRLLETLEPRVLMAADFTGVLGDIAGMHVKPGQTEVVAFTLQNAGDAAAKGSVTVDLFAMPDGGEFDASTATKLGTAKLKGALAIDGSSDATINALFAPSLQPGDYQIVARLTSKPADGNPSNDVIVSENALTVDQADYDLSPSLGKQTVPTAIVTGAATKGSVQVVITNPGESASATPKGLTAGVKVVLRPAGAEDSSQDVSLLAKPVSAKIGGLTPGKSKSANASLGFPSNLAAGDYQVIVRVDADNAVNEANESNNDVVVSTVTVADPFIDLGAAINDAKTKLPAGSVISGTAASVTLAVDITNSGNVATAKTQTGTIRVWAHNIDDEGADPVNLGQFNTKLGNLAPGKTSTQTLKVSLPAELSDGHWTIEAVVEGTVGEDDFELSATTDGSVNVQQGFVDLAVTAGSTTFGSTAVGEAAGTATATIVNNGNLPASGSATVTFWATPGVGSPVKIGETTVSVKLAPGASLTLKPVSVTLPNPDGTTSYTISAEVAFEGDTAAGNNTLDLGSSVSVTHKPPVLFAGVGDSIKFTATTTINHAGQFMQNGTFVTSTGKTGTFQYTYTQGGTYNVPGLGQQTVEETGALGLFFDSNDPTVAVGLNLSYYKHKGISFSGKTVVFSFDSAKAFGETENTPTVYLRFG